MQARTESGLSCPSLPPLPHQQMPATQERGRQYDGDERGEKAKRLREDLPWSISQQRERRPRDEASGFWNVKWPLSNRVTRFLFLFLPSPIPCPGGTKEKRNRVPVFCFSLPIRHCRKPREENLSCRLLVRKGDDTYGVRVRVHLAAPNDAETNESRFRHPFFQGRPPCRRSIPWSETTQGLLAVVCVFDVCVCVPSLDNEKERKKKKKPKRRNKAQVELEFLVL